MGISEVTELGVLCITEQCMHAWKTLHERGRPTGLSEGLGCALTNQVTLGGVLVDLI